MKSCSFFWSWHGLRVRRPWKSLPSSRNSPGAIWLAWDVGFYAERLQRSRLLRFAGRNAAVLPLPHVLTGLFEVASRLFGSGSPRSRMRPSGTPDVRFFEIHGADGHSIGSFYLDAYARSNKRSGAWMDECVGRSAWTSGSALPVAYLVCNFLPPNAGRPALLTHDDVLTLFPRVRPRIASHADPRETIRASRASTGCRGMRWSFRANSSRTTRGTRKCCGESRVHVDTKAPLPPETQARTDFDSQLPRRTANDAAARICAVRFPFARRVRPLARGRV